MQSCSKLLKVRSYKAQKSGIQSNEIQILQQCRVLANPFTGASKQVTAAYLKSIDIKDGDRKCFIPRINLPIYSVC